MASNSVRLLHLADIHIGMENYGQLDPSVGVNSRIMDFLRRFDEAVDYALKREIDLVIFAGDAYKTRDPNPTYLREFARRVKRLADAGIPVVLLVGNHDLPGAVKRASSVSIFQTLRVENVFVADTEELHRIKTRRGVPVQVATVPYPARSRLMAHARFKNLSLRELDDELRAIVTDNIRALAAQLDPQMPAILAAHLSVAQAKQGSEQHVMIGRDTIILKSVVTNPAFDYVALGHIHKYQDLNAGEQPPVIYAGSIERIDFGEEGEQKGFVVADIEKGHATYEFVPVQARRFLTIRVQADGSDPMSRILREIAGHDVTDSVVRVIIRTDEECEPLIQEKEIRQALKGAYYISAITKDIQRRYRQRLGGQSVEELTPREALRRYLEARETPAERIRTLLNYAEQIFQGKE